MFIVGRVFRGIACGIMFALCPVYASDISPPGLRGMVAALYSLNISFSYMVTEWSGLAFYFIHGTASWRLLFGLQFAPGALMLAGSFFMPFSPRWLALKGRYDEAEEVLRRIHDNNEDQEFYEREFYQIKAQIERIRRRSWGLRTFPGRSRTFVESL
jgi:MFS family permease